MRALVDAQAMLWYANDDPRLPARVKLWFGDSDSTPVLSAASAWEIIIKASSGKLTLRPDPVQFIEQFAGDMQMERLPIGFAHVYRLAQLPPLHRDPFDRMLVAQALAEGIAVVTGDDAIARYGVETVWDE